MFCYIARILSIAGFYLVYVYNSSCCLFYLQQLLSHLGIVLASMHARLGIFFVFFFNFLEEL